MCAALPPERKASFRPTPRNHGIVTRLNHVIVTATDAGHAGFVLNHWLPSLLANVNLDGIDIVVLDYGLQNAQRATLEEQDVICYQAEKDAHVTSIRYRDMARFLTEHNCDQVLAVDGGDVLFQSDISHLFEEHKTEFRAACEDVSVPLHDLIIPRDDFTPQQYRDISRFLRGTRNINSGVIFGPAARVRALWDEFTGLCRSTNVHLTDQLLINYIFYRDGFHLLDSRYNFVTSTTRAPFHIRNGVFYDKENRIIPVVHNAGITKKFRCVDNFGYGPGYNRKKRVTLLLLHMLYAAIAIGRKLRVPRGPSDSSAE